MYHSPSRPMSQQCENSCERLAAGPRRQDQPMHIREPFRALIAIVIGSATSLSAIALLFRSPVSTDFLFLLACAAALVLPTLVTLRVLYPDSLRRSPARQERLADTPWLEAKGDDEQGYSLIGDQRAFEALGSECLRLAREASSGDFVHLRLDGVEIRELVRQDVRPTPPTPTWKDRVSAVLGALLMALFMTALARGCVALTSDASRWLK